MSAESSNQDDVLPSETTSMVSLLTRVQRALGPALPGIVLDLVDALSLTKYFGPVISFPVGVAVGAWLSSYYSFSFRWKALIALGSGLYTMTPGTEAIPLATILTCLGRFVENSPETKSATSFAAGSSMESTEAADSEQLTADAGDQLQPTVSANKLRRSDRTGAKCPECGSISLRYGQVGERFWPTGSSTWAKGHEVHAFACLDCGFVGHYLSSADLNELEKPKS